MKHLMIYEAFQSKAISDVINHIKKKIGTFNVNAFIIELKSIQDMYDIPIDKIKEEDIIYLPAIKAKKTQPDKTTKYYNDNMIFNIKFWFSIEGGYLGKSAMGKYSQEFDDDDIFTQSEIEYINNNLDIKTGRVTKVSIGDLKNGDHVLLDIKGIINARIYADGDHFYAIQDSQNGGSPESNDWKLWGRYSWYLGSKNFANGDHAKLHLYEKNDKEFIYNTPAEYPHKDLYLLPSGEFDPSKESPSYIKNSDFAIVLNINNIFKKGFKKVSGIRKERIDSRHGALSFMTDEQVKNANIDRYFNKIVNKMGIKPDSVNSELKNLQNIVKLSICQDMPFYSIYRNSPSIRIIDDLSGCLNRLLRYQDAIYYNELVNKYKKAKANNKKISKLYRDSMYIVNKDDNKYIKLIFSKFEEINKIIKNYIESLEINNLYDLNAVYYKFNYIIDLISDDMYNFEISTRNILINFDDPEEVEFRLNRVLIDDIEEDIKKVEFLYKNIKSILN
jgi:hypothetical protein